MAVDGNNHDLIHTVTWFTQQMY